MVAPLCDCCCSELCNHSHMTRSELINRLAVHFPMLAAQDAEKSVTLILDAIARVLARGSRVEIRSSGVLSQPIDRPESVEIQSPASWSAFPQSRFCVSRRGRSYEAALIGPPLPVVTEICLSSQCQIVVVLNGPRSAMTGRSRHFSKAAVRAFAVCICATFPCAAFRANLMLYKMPLDGRRPLYSKGVSRE